MNCKRARELIVTDYLDKEIDTTVKDEVDKHLIGCRGCAKFAEAATSISDGLFRDAHHLKPPEYVWRRIRDAVENEKKAETPNLFFRIWDRVRCAVPSFRPAYAIITAVTFIMIIGAAAGVYMNKNHVSGYPKSESDQYFSYVEDLLAAGLSNGDVGFGTSIEESFL